MDAAAYNYNTTLPVFPIDPHIPLELYRTFFEETCLSVFYTNCRYHTCN